MLFVRRRRRRFFDHRGRGCARDHRRCRLIDEYLRAQTGGAQSVLSRRRADRRHGRSSDMGQELSAAIRRLQTDGGSSAHPLRRQRSRAAHADQGRSALGRRAIEDRRRPALEGDVGRLRLRQGFSRGARPRVHARRPDLHRAPTSRQTTRHVPSMPRFALCAL